MDCLVFTNTNMQVSGKQQILQTFFKILDWLIFIGLVLSAVLFVKDVIIHFQSGDTSIKVSSKRMEHMAIPTITFCFQPTVKTSVLNKYGFNLFDFVNTDVPNLSQSWPDFYNEVSYKVGIDFYVRMSLTEHISGFHNKKHENLVIESINLTKNQLDLIDFEEVYTLDSGLCYKITPKINTTGGQYNDIELFFYDTLPIEDIPRVELFFSSEDNAYGIITSNWVLGDIYSMRVKSKSLLKIKVKFTPMNYEKLLSKCKKGASIKCISQKYTNVIIHYYCILHTCFITGLWHLLHMDSTITMAKLT